MARERFSSSEDEIEKINKRASTDRKKEIEEEKMIREVLKTGNVSVPEKEIEENQINEEDVQPEIEVPAEVLKVKEPRLKGEFFGGAARIKEGNKQTKKEEARPLEKKEVIKGEKGEEPQKPAESQIKQEKIKEDKESQIKEVKRALIFAIENGRNEKEIKLWKNKLREFSGEDQLSPEELTGCIRNFIGNLKIKLEKLNPEEPKEELIRISNLESMADQRIFGCPEGDRACQELYKEIKNLRTLYAEIRGKQKEEPKMEKSEIEQPKINKETATAEKEKAAEQKRLEEIEKRPEPQKNEALEDWLTRMGGPYGRVEKLEMCSKCGRISLEKGCKCSKEQMKSTPLIIDSEGNLLANGENVNKYFDVTKLADEAAKKNPNIAFIFERGGEWGLKKELFGRPDAYLHFIRETLKKKREIVVSKDFQNKVMRDWYEAFYKGLPNYPENFPNFPDKKLAKKEKPAEAGKEKVEEKPKKKERPEKKKPEKEVKEKPKKKEKKKKEEKPKPEEEKKPLTLDEQIAQKQKELEEVEMKHNIYYSPVVRDLLGLYYDKRLKDLRKEMKELGKEKKKKKPSSAKAAEGKEPKEMHEKSPTAKEYLTHIKGTDKLFNEMTKARWEVKKKKGKETRLKYEKAKKEWQDAYKKTLAMEGRLNPKVLEKISKILEKERAKAKKVGLLRKIWSFFKLVAKKFGKEVIEEVKHDVLEKQLETVKQRIKQGGVLGRATLEKEQKRLEKRLKKLKKK